MDIRLLDSGLTIAVRVYELYDWIGPRYGKGQSQKLRHPTNVRLKIGKPLGLHLLKELWHAHRYGVHNSEIHL
jgi:hypothetical protein